MSKLENITSPSAHQTVCSATEVAALKSNSAGAVGFGEIELDLIGFPVVDTWDRVDRLVRVVMGLGLGAGDMAGGAPWYAGFRGVDLAAPDVALPENWGGTRGVAGMARWFGAGPTDADLYWSIAPMGVGEGRRSAGGAVAQRVLIADDIGTKVDAGLWETRFARGCPRPTMEIETSPGNRTFVWALDGDGMDPARWTDLALIRAWMIEDGLTDAVMDVCRYVRLPCGWNSKQKYREAGQWAATGRPPGVRLVAWRPGRVDFELVGMTLVGGPAPVGPWRDRGAPVGAAAQSALTGGQLLAGGALVRSADLGSPDAIMGLGIRLGMDLQGIGPGVVSALCPNIGAHTVRAETGFAFLGGGLMHCNHASCVGFGTADFRGMMVAAYTADAHGPGEAATGGGWLAVEELRLLGALTPAAIAEALAEANRLAAARAASKASSGEEKTSKKPPHISAIEMLSAEGIDAFCDEIGKVWVWLNGKLLCLSSSSGFRPMLGWLAERGLDLVGTARTNLVETLQARASTKPSRSVRFRIGNGGTLDAPVVYVNLMDAQGRGIKVDLNGWEVTDVADFPMDLADRQGSLLLPVPLRDSVKMPFFARLERHFPLPPVTNPDDPADAGVQVRAAILAFLMGQFYRTGTVPHLALAGEQGGGKTTAARRLVSLTDPDVDEARPSLPADPTAVFALVGQRSNFVLDNISGVKSEHADILCVLATGGTHSTRSLYTNDERSMMRAKTSVIITSVLPDGITKRPDLIDRILLVQTQPLPKDKRRAEAELDAAWEADRPYLLADLLDLLSVALKNVSSIRSAQAFGLLPPPPRIADVAQAAEAAAWHGLGWSPGLCTNALNAMRSEAAQDQLTDDPFAFRLRERLRQTKNGVWIGSYTELETALQFMDGPDWGDRRVTVKNRLSRVKGPLRELWGIDVKPEGRKSSARIYEFRLASVRAA